MKKIIAILAFIFVLMQGSYASLDISRIGFGARAIGLGRAQTALSDVGSVFINPGNIAAYETFAITSMYSNVADDSAFSVFGGVFPIRDGELGVIGVGYVGASVAGIQLTTSETRTAPYSQTDYGNRVLMFTYGRELNSFVGFGTTLKFFTKSFDSIQGGSAYGNDMDLGFVFYPQENITAGVSLQNFLPTQLVWTSKTKEDIPMNVRMGLNYKALDKWKILADYESNRYSHFGVEWNPKEFLFLRGGLEGIPVNNTDILMNYSLGVGFAFKGFCFDYAYYLDSLVSDNSSHFFSISYYLPPKTVESRPIMPANSQQLAKNPD